MGILSRGLPPPPKPFGEPSRPISDMEKVQALMKKHRECFERWPFGEPIRYFLADGLPCVAYENETWFHYDIERGVWF